MPSVALVLVFNTLTLWTLVTVSVEWARHGALNASGLRKTGVQVLKTPIVIGILCGTAFALTGLTLPAAADVALTGVGYLAGPLALLVLGMGISGYGFTSGWRESVAICVIKLMVQPLVVWLLALALPALERQVVVLLASLSVGANVYLMSIEFQTLERPVATSRSGDHAVAPGPGGVVRAGSHRLSRVANSWRRLDVRRSRPGAVRCQPSLRPRAA